MSLYHSQEAQQFFQVVEHVFEIGRQAFGVVKQVIYQHAHQAFV